MIHSKGDSLSKGNDVGLKALRLIQLSQIGYTIPPFVVITGEELCHAHNTITALDEYISKLIPEIQTSLPCESYAVRSSTNNEDLVSHSGAGQFTTLLNVSLQELQKSILAVIEDAKEKLPRGLQDCSVIIQQYVQPDFAGVLFTRNPTEGREMIIEYRHGVGDRVVGGDAVKKIQCLHEHAKQHIHSLPNITELSRFATELERLYDFPQDIEWAYKDGTTYLLQARPITSIKKERWQGIVLTESELAMQTKKRFYFEKTSLSETFNRPRPLSFSILKALHAEKGPIEKTYAHLSIVYQPHRELFHIFGTELFVDKQIEIKTLFPSLGYTKANTEKPRLETLYGLYTTIKNMWALSRISLKNYPHHAERLGQLKNTAPSEMCSIKESVEVLLEQYTTIFEINIFSQKALSVIKKMLGNNSPILPELLTHHKEMDEAIATLPNREASTSLRGNSLNIDDTSPFIEMSAQIKKIGSDKDYWGTLPTWKQKILTPHIIYARKYTMLRESARILSVQLINTIRTCVEDQAKILFPKNPHLIYFATLEELMEGTVQQSVCEERKKYYEKNIKIITPPYLASFVKVIKDTSCVGVSSGRAEGTFVTPEDLHTTPGAKILYTELLLPHIAQHFGSIVGIVSKNGGVLSHLAILARESHIPVVVTNGSVPIPLGKMGCIDGNTGEIKIPSEDKSDHMNTSDLA
jgi:phosphohistidine swiveling domain-containing protein